jgi:hypothetical protein
VIEWQCCHKKAHPVPGNLHGGKKEQVMAEDIKALKKDADAAPWAATYEEILGKGQTLAYTNVGKSMMPLLRQRRDILIIEPRPSGRLKKYDVPL